MTTNKQFNTYKEGLDLEFLREYCMEHGERRVMERGETLEEAGEPAQWVAYVERGCFKYMVHNDEEGKDYCTGFAFEGEFVSDFPYCLDGDLSEVSIEANMPCEVRVISGQELQALIDNNPKMAKMDVKILKSLFVSLFLCFSVTEQMCKAHRKIFLCQVMKSDLYIIKNRHMTEKSNILESSCNSHFVYLSRTFLRG